MTIEAAPREIRKIPFEGGVIKDYTDYGPDLGDIESPFYVLCADIDGQKCEVHHSFEHDPKEWVEVAEANFLARSSDKQRMTNFRLIKIAVKNAIKAGYLVGISEIELVIPC